MKIKNSVPIATSILLAIVLIVMACTQVTPNPTPTSTASTPTATNPATPALTPTPTTIIQEVDKKYNVLDPTGIFFPVQTQAIAPRLATIEGKTIYVCQGEADPVVMPGLYKALVAKFTTTKFIYYDRSDFGPTSPGTGGTATSTGQP
jgi:hypothetical protein